MRGSYPILTAEHSEGGHEDARQYEAVCAGVAVSGTWRRERSAQRADVNGMNTNLRVSGAAECVGVSIVRRVTLSEVCKNGRFLLFCIFL